MHAKNRALILADDFRLPYKVLRCAASCCREVYVAGGHGASGLRNSKFAKGFIEIGGSFASHGEETAKWIDLICEHFGIEWIIPSCPLTTRFLSVYGKMMKTPCYPVPSASAFDLLDDKWQFATLCNEIGVTHPSTTYIPNAQHLHRLYESRAVQVPLILKPLNLWGSVGVIKICQPSDLPSSFEYGPCILQEFVPGKEVSAFYLCRAGVIIKSIQYQRNGRGIVLTDCKPINEGAETIIKYLSYNGVIGFDVKFSDDKTPFFLECNPRFWYRMDLVSVAGVNFVMEGLSPDYNVVSSAAPINMRVGAYRELLSRILTPWRLSRYDFAFLRYLAGDPVPSLMAISNALIGSSLVGNGARF